MHLPHLRRLRICPAVYPALPGWATIFRASGAESQLTNRSVQTTSRHSRVASYNRRFTIQGNACLQVRIQDKIGNLAVPVSGKMKTRHYHWITFIGAVLTLVILCPSRGETQPQGTPADLRCQVIDEN